MSYARCCLRVVAMALLGTGCASSCLVEGTLISTPGGLRPVEAIRVGDCVFSRGPDGRGEVDVVRAKHVATARGYVRIVCADGRSLCATAAHPVATDRGWLSVGEISAGQEVVLEGGGPWSPRSRGSLGA